MQVKEIIPYTNNAMQKISSFIPFVVNYIYDSILQEAALWFDQIRK